MAYEYLENVLYVPLEHIENGLIKLGSFFLSLSVSLSVCMCVCVYVFMFKYGVFMCAYESAWVDIYVCACGA